LDVEPAGFPFTSHPTQDILYILQGSGDGFNAGV